MTIPYLNPTRFYRQNLHPRLGECSFQVTLAESDLKITAQKNLASEALNSLNRLRGQLQAWISLHPEFKTSLAPLPIPKHCPEIVRQMLMAGQLAKVGPMASVAGCLAQKVAEELLEFSSEVIVENGGDIYLCSSQERIVGILSEPEQGLLLGLKLKPADFPLSLCSSSATIGHSLSLGQGELALVRGKDGALTDAYATALGNCLKSAKDVGQVLELVKKLPPAQHIDGVFLQCQGKIGIYGNFELVGLGSTL